MIALCIGCTGAGKSTKARALVAQLARETGRRVVVVDCEGDRAFASLPRASDVDALAAQLKRARVVAFDAERAGPRELDRLARFIRELGNLIVLVDGAWAALDCRTPAKDPWVALCRKHRHANLALVLTTHHLGSDVSQSLQSFGPDLFVFCTTSPAALDTLERQYGLDRKQIRALRQGSFVHVRQGFANRA